MCLFSIASVSAGDFNDTVNTDPNDDILYNAVTADTGIVDDYNESSFSESNDHNGWDDLDRDIQNLQPGDVYDIKQDYMKPDNASVIGINIKADNVTINGNGHVIYGNINNILKDGESVDAAGNIFTVSGNNVKIYNLTISNAGYEAPADSFELSSTIPTINVPPDSWKRYIYLNNSQKIFLSGINFSPICWIGNNGICSDCVFRNNKAFAGGSITWIGNDGLVNNTKFINSSATRVGGAIYIFGDSNHGNITCYNVSSGWIENNAIYNPHAFVSPFYSEIVCNIFGTEMDFTKCLFDTLFYGGVRDLNGTICYAQINGTDLALTFAKDIHNLHTFTFLNRTWKIYGPFITLTQTFYFENVVNNRNDSYHIADNIFHALQSLNFTIDYKRTLVENVIDVDSYKYVIDLKADEVFEHMPDYYTYYSAILPKTNINHFDVLRVDILNDIKSHKTWKPQNMGFDIIYIDGHNSTIDGDSGKRDEHKFASLSDGNYVFQVSNLVLWDFNNAIVNNGGYCICENVLFKENKMKYIIDQDFGAAIKNSGLTICNNCSFIKNYCSRGGAIFNQGALILNNCSFKDNDAYRVGDDVLNVNKGQVFLDGEQINGSYGVVKYKKSISSTLTKILKWGSVAISAVVGVVVGFVTKSPAIGLAAGAVTGLVLGTIASIVINRYTYDMNYNPLKNTIFIIGVNVAAGIAGGVIGGCIGGLTSTGAVTNGELLYTADGPSDVESVISTRAYSWD